MNTIFDELVNDKREPSRGDIGKLLASVADPGLERDEKQLAVKKLFEALGYNGRNPQGHAVWDSLEDYGEY